MLTGHKGILRVLLFLYAVALVCPLRFWPLVPILDGSWLFGFNYASAHGLILGRDILSTTGPWAYLTAPMDLGRNLQSGVRFQAGLWILLASVIFNLYFQSGLPLRNLAIFSFFFGLAAPLFWVNRVGTDNLILAIALVCLVVYQFRGGTFRLVLALVLIGFVGTIKFTSLFIGGGALIGFAAERILVLRRRAWSEVALVVLVPTITIAVCIFATIPIANLGEFIKTAVEISGGYSVAMSVTAHTTELAGAVGSLLLVVALGIINSRGGRVSGRFLALLFAIPLFISFKHGYVRQDSHTLNWFCFCSLVVAIIALSLNLSLRLRPATAVMFSFGLLWQYYIFARWDFSELKVMMTGLRSIHRGVEFLDLPRLKAGMAAQALSESSDDLRVEPAILKLIGDSPVTLLTETLAQPVVLDKLHLVLFPPVFAGEAYTPYLDEKTADWIVAKAPRFILFDGYTIDRREAWAEMPATWNQIYRLYDSRLLGTRSLLLERRSTPRFSHLVPTAQLTVSPAQGFRIPDVKGPLFWTMACPLNVQGKVSKVLFRVPPLMMDAETAGGNTLRFRAIMSQLVNPVIASLPVSLSEFAVTLSPDGIGHLSARRLSVSPGGPAGLYESTCQVTFLVPAPQATF